jgi:hypothetical protein
LRDENLDEIGMDQNSNHSIKKKTKPKSFLSMIGKFHSMGSMPSVGNEITPHVHVKSNFIKSDSEPSNSKIVKCLTLINWLNAAMALGEEKNMTIDKLRTDREHLSLSNMSQEIAQDSNQIQPTISALGAIENQLIQNTRKTVAENNRDFLCEPNRKLNLTQTLQVGDVVWALANHGLKWFPAIVTNIKKVKSDPYADSNLSPSFTLNSNPTYHYFYDIKYLMTQRELQHNRVIVSSRQFLRPHSTPNPNPAINNCDEMKKKMNFLLKITKLQQKEDLSNHNLRKYNLTNENLPNNEKYADLKIFNLKISIFMPEFSYLNHNQLELEFDYIKKFYKEDLLFMPERLKVLHFFRLVQFENAKNLGKNTESTEQELGSEGLLDVMVLRTALIRPAYQEIVSESVALTSLFHPYDIGSKKFQILEQYLNQNIKSSPCSTTPRASPRPSNTISPLISPNISNCSNPNSQLSPKAPRLQRGNRSTSSSKLDYGEKYLKQQTKFSRAANVKASKHSSPNISSDMNSSTVAEIISKYPIMLVALESCFHEAKYISEIDFVEFCIFSMEIYCFNNPSLDPNKSAPKPPLSVIINTSYDANPTLSQEKNVVQQSPKYETRNNFLKRIKNTSVGSQE